VVVIQIEMMTTGQTITITKKARRSRTNLGDKKAAGDRSLRPLAALSLVLLVRWLFRMAR
jgi:hypothetical protein